MKRFGGIVLGVLLMCSVALAGCGTQDSVGELNAQIEELQAKIDALNAQIEELKDQGESAARGLQETEQKLQELKEQSSLLYAIYANLAGEEPTFSSEARPVYEYDLEDVIKEGNIASFDNMRCGEEEDSFELFYDYYQAEIEGKRNLHFGILDPGNREKGWMPHLRHKKFDFYQKGDDLFVSEYLMLYDEVLGSPLTGGTGVQFEGGTECSITFAAFLAPIPDELWESDYLMTSFEYGRDDGAKYDIGKRFINIYLDAYPLEETCVATIYYKTGRHVSANWFSRFFAKNLLVKV